MSMDEKSERGLKMGNVVVTTEAMSVEGKSSFPVDTSFWEDLWDQYTNEFEEVVIHCWMEELDILEELNSRAVSVQTEGLMKVFTINLTDENRLYFRNYSVDPKGGLKWFTMFFQQDGVEQMEVGHYGSEIILYKVNKEEAEKFVEIFPKIADSEYHATNGD